MNVPISPEHLALVLVLWEGTSYKPPIYSSLSRTHKKKCSGFLDAWHEISTYFTKTPVAMCNPIVGPAFFCSEQQGWVEKVVNMVYVLIGKMKV